jgi:hypothetical protein
MTTISLAQKKDSVASQMTAAPRKPQKPIPLRRQIEISFILKERRK